MGSAIIMKLFLLNPRKNLLKCTIFILCEISCIKIIKKPFLSFSFNSSFPILKFMVNFIFLSFKPFHQIFDIFMFFMFLSSSFELCNSLLFISSYSSLSYFFSSLSFYSRFLFSPLSFSFFSNLSFSF